MKAPRSPRPALAAALFLFAATFGRAENATPAYLDPAQPLEVRTHDLVSRMTLEEKASMMQNTTPGVPRLGIPKYDWWSEALHGVANSGYATVFPQAIGLAAMWDESLHHEIAHTIGIEGRAKFNASVGTDKAGLIFYGLTFWSPNINIFRDPRWGRGQETYGEDPYLTSTLGVAFVRGLQGDDPHYLQAAACAKHFAVHSGPESLRHIFDVTPVEADLYETYLPSFETLVREAHVEIIMTAYNSINGTPCSINPLLYSELKKWGFNGHITSDCGSVEDLTHTYKRSKNAAEAEAMTLTAGMNVCCGTEATALPEAVRSGLISESVVDQRLADLLRTMFRLGFFDPKDRVPYNRIAPSENNSPEHGALSLVAARECMVLLKNNGILPLKASSLHRVAVIGPNATSVPVLLGNYNGTPVAPITILAGLKAALGASVQIDYAHGCDYGAVSAEMRPIATTWFPGEYFANRELKGTPTAKRWERPIHFDFSNPASSVGKPEGLPDHDISARWTGTVPTTLAGDYQLAVRGRGGFRLTIDGKVVIDSWTPAGEQSKAVREVKIAYHLPENASPEFKLEYVQGDGPANISLDWSTPKADSGLAEAIEVAKKADLIVYVGGISAQLEGEEMDVQYEGFFGGDRQTIELPPLQLQLLEKLKATGKPLVMVNMSGSSLAMPWASEHADALLQAWYPGQAGGTAVADVLLGNYNPAGRLPVTFYRSTADLPDFKDYRMANRTYRYFSGKPLYPFGFGLSYTNFDYAGLKATPSANSTVQVSLEVSNSGKMDGDEVVQLYAVPPAESHPREVHALSGFRRIHLNKGEKKTVTIDIPTRALRRWNSETHAYYIPSGEWTIQAAASSADIRQSVKVKL